MSELHLFTKLDDDTYLTEDGFLIEIKEFDGLFVWANSSTGWYDQPCDTVCLGLIEESRRSSRRARCSSFGSMKSQRPRRTSGSGSI